MEEQSENRRGTADEQAEYRGAITDFALGVAAGLAADGVKDGVKIVGKQVIAALKTDSPKDV